LERANSKRIQLRINTIINEINQQGGTADVLTDWITANRLNDLKQIDYLNILGNFIHEFDVGYNSAIVTPKVGIVYVILFSNGASLQDGYHAHLYSFVFAKLLLGLPSGFKQGAIHPFGMVHG
jgi:hypothetical protein